MIRDIGFGYDVKTIAARPFKMIKRNYDDVISHCQNLARRVRDDE